MKAVKERQRSFCRSGVAASAAGGGAADDGGAAGALESNSDISTLGVVRGPSGYRDVAQPMPL
jgi:hypothetical protein